MRVESDLRKDFRALGLLRHVPLATTAVFLLIGIASLAVSLLHERLEPSLVLGYPLPSATPAKPMVTQDPVEEPVDVLVWVESTPPGARIVRVSDAFVLGRTPEIIEFRRSATPVPLRFELDGHHPTNIEASAVSDGKVAVVLTAVQKRQASIK